MKKLFWVLGLLLVFAGTAMAGTADDMTPAEETGCDGLSGAPWGLCNAYCEAMDCDSDTPKASDEACTKTAEQFAEKTSGDILPCDQTTGLDQDGDGVPDYSDNCPFVANEDQNDIDNNDVGDECDCPCYSRDDIYLSQNYNRRFSFDTGVIGCSESPVSATLRSEHQYIEATTSFAVEHYFYGESSDGCTNDCADVCAITVWVRPDGPRLLSDIVDVSEPQAQRCIQYITEVCQDLSN